MAGRDYVTCKRCHVRIFYDGYDNVRNTLEEKWGDPDAPGWTIGLLCPDCISKYEKAIDGLTPVCDCEGCRSIDDAKETIYIPETMVGGHK